MAVTEFVHHPHPHTETRKLKPPPKLSDEHIGWFKAGSALNLLAARA